MYSIKKQQLMIQSWENLEMDRWTNGQKKWHTEVDDPLKNLDQTLGNAI